MTPNYILLFDLLLLVNVATFVAVLWLFCFNVWLDCRPLHHIYHTLLAIFIIHLLYHSLPLSLRIILHQYYLLIFQKLFLVLPQFHVGPEICLVLVEYWLTRFIHFVVLCTCLIILGVIGILVKLICFTILLVCRCNNLCPPWSLSIRRR